MHLHGKLRFHAQAPEACSAKLAAAQVLSPLFAQLSYMAGAAAPAPLPVEAGPPMGTAEGRLGNAEDARQAVHPSAEPQAEPAVPLVHARSVPKERPLWRRAAVGCALS